MPVGIARSSDTRTSFLVVVHDPAWAEPLVRWTAAEADRRGRRHLIVWTPGSEARDAAQKAAARLAPGTVELVAVEEPSPGAIAERLADLPDAVLAVGPLRPAALADLLFGVSAPGHPVLVVPPCSWSAPLPGASPSTITVGFHGTRPAKAALGWAVDEAELRGGLVRAVMVWWEGDYASVGGTVPVEVGRHHLVGTAARDLADRTLAETETPAGRVETVSRRGTPGKVLAKEAVGSDLLVVGGGQLVVHRHRVLGPVALGCLARSPVPVVVVPSSAG